MRSVCGPVRLSQEIESSAAAFYPNCDSPRSKFSEPLEEINGMDLTLLCNLIWRTDRPSPLPHTYIQHIIIVKSVLMGLLLTRPPTAHLRHSTCLSALRGPLGNQGADLK